MNSSHTLHLIVLSITPVVYFSVHFGVQLDRVQAGILRTIRVPNVGRCSGLGPGGVACGRRRSNGRRSDL